jgi:hypothetical protein
VNLRQFGGGNRLADALQARKRDSNALSCSDNLVFSTRVVNQLRFQYSRLAPSFKTAADDRPVVLITLNDPSTSGTLIAGSSTLGGSDRREDRTQLQQILSMVQGEHSLKLGVDIHHVRSTFIELTRVLVIFSRASRTVTGKTSKAHRRRATRTLVSSCRTSGNYIRACS